MNAAGLQNATAADILSWTYRRFGRVALVASFQAESLVLIDLACRIMPEPEVLTLDTGRLHEETHDYIEYVRRQFPIRLRILAPDASELEAMTGEHGDMPFRESVPLRNPCCAVRKVNRWRARCASTTRGSRGSVETRLRRGRPPRSSPAIPDMTG
jgi:phosphoadenosine phosphosulfate reductase